MQVMRPNGFLLPAVVGNVIPYFEAPRCLNADFCICWFFV